MITAIVVGIVVGLVLLALVSVCASSWGRRRLPEWFLEHAPAALVGLIGVVGSIVVARIVHDDSWSLFFVQLAAAMATMLVIGWPLRHRLCAM